MYKIRAQVHRFHDLVSVFVGGGQSVYLKVADAKALGAAILEAALDVENSSYLSSHLPTREFAFEGGHKAKVDRSQAPLSLYSVTGRIPGSDDDSTLILAARNEEEASAAFKEEMLAINAVSKETVEFLIKQYDSPVYVTGTQVIGQIANGFVRVADSNLLKPADAISDDVLDEVSRALIDEIPDGASEFSIQHYDDSGMYELIAHVGHEKHPVGIAFESRAAYERQAGAIKGYYAEREQAAPAPTTP